MTTWVCPFAAVVNRHARERQGCTAHVCDDVAHNGHLLRYGQPVALNLSGLALLANTVLVFVKRFHLVVVFTLSTLALFGLGLSIFLLVAVLCASVVSFMSIPLFGHISFRIGQNPL